MKKTLFTVFTVFSLVLGGCSIKDTINNAFGNSEGTKEETPAEDNNQNNNNNNDDTHSHVDLNHDGICDTCEEPGLPIIHVDNNHDDYCDICHTFLGSGPCSHVDDNHDGICDRCAEEGLPVTHIDENHDDHCDICSAYLGDACTHVDNNHDGTCDLCGETTLLVAHIDNNYDEYCDVCGKFLGEDSCSHTDLNHDGQCDLCDTTGLEVIHIDNDNDDYCDICHAFIGTEPCSHLDTDHDGVCDLCEKSGLAINHIDVNHDGICDICGAEITTVIGDNGNYFANIVDNNGNVIKTKYQNFESNENGFSVNPGSKAVFSTENPINKGIDSITVNVSGSSNFESIRIVALYFSYFELNISDIFAGKHQDLVATFFEIYDSIHELTVNSEAYSNIRSARYILGLVINGDETDSLTISNISINSLSGADLTPIVDSEYINYQEDYTQEVEDLGLEFFTNSFIFPNGSFSFFVDEYSDAYFFSSLLLSTDMLILTSNLMEEGYEITSTDNHEEQYRVIFQKKSGKSIYTYYFMYTVVSVGDNADDQFVLCTIACTTVLPYQGTTDSWPTQYLIEAGASSELLAAFDGIELENAKYSLVESYTSLCQSGFRVQIEVSDFASAIEEVNSYLASYDGKPTYVVDQLRGVIEKDDGKYVLWVGASGNNKIYVGIQEYFVYDHFPLVELGKEIKKNDFPTEHIFSGSFSEDGAVAANAIIGRNINENDLNDFIKYFEDYGYIYYGNENNGVLVEHPSSYSESIITLKISQIDTGVYKFSWYYNDTGKVTLSDYLSEFASSYLSNIEGKAESLAKKYTEITINLTNGNYHSILGLRNGNNETKTEILGLFDDEVFETTQLGADFYQIAFRGTYHFSFLFVRFIEVDGGLYIKIGLEAEYYTFATNYDEVNNLTESVLGEDSITLKSGRYGIIHTNGTKSFNIQTVGSLTEMLKIKSEFDEEIKKNTKYVYNTRNDAYLDLENRISASCHIVNGTNTGDRYHLFRLHIIYGAFESEPADFASYSDSGISDIPLMSNFPELPQLSGKKAYRVVSSTESEVRIEVNKDFEFYNNYYSKLKSYGFNGNSKTVGDVTYKFLEDYSYYGTHDMYVFSATTN